MAVLCVCHAARPALCYVARPRMKGGRRARESGRAAAAGSRSAARRGEGAGGEARRAAGRAGTGDGELAEDAAALAEALAAELASDAEERNAAEDGLYVLGKCYGCGARLQMLTPGAAGFVDSAVYETKRRHRQHNTHILCARCQGLSNNKLTSAVVGVAGVQNTDPKTFVSTPEQLRETLAELNQAKVLVVLLVDLADASGTMLPSVRDLVGGNPIILVGTKADLLPTTCEPGGVTRWLEAEARRRGLGTLAGCYLTSSSDATRPAPRRRGTADRNAFATTRMPRGNLPAVVAAIRREQRGRDVVVVGAANVGKSAFINAMLGFEYAFQVFFRYTPSSIDHFDTNFILPAAILAYNLSLIGIHDGVFNQVDQHLPDSVAVRIHLDWGVVNFKLQVLGFGFGLQQIIQFQR